MAVRPYFNPASPNRKRRRLHMHLQFWFMYRVCESEGKVEHTVDWRASWSINTLSAAWHLAQQIEGRLLRNWMLLDGAERCDVNTQHHTFAAREFISTIMLEINNNNVGESVYTIASIQRYFSNHSTAAHVVNVSVVIIDVTAVSSMSWVSRIKYEISLLRKRKYGIYEPMNQTSCT